MNSVHQLLAYLPTGGWQRLAFDALWQSAVIAGLGYGVAQCFRRRPAVRAWVLLLTLSACLIVPLASAASRSAGWGVLAMAEQVQQTEERENGNRGEGERLVVQDSAVSPLPLDEAVAVDQPEFSILADEIDAHEPRTAIQQPPTTSLAVSATTSDKSSAAIISHSPRPPFSPSFFFAAVWLPASAILAVRLLLGTLAVRRILRRAAACDDSQLLAAAEEAARRVGLRRTPAVLTSADVQSPMVLALGKPRLLVPRCSPLAPREDAAGGALNSAEVSSENSGQHSTESNAAAAANFSRSEKAALGEIDWTAAFTHELAHVARGDGWSRLWVELITIALPLQPLIWLARRSFYFACEETCDDWSVAAGSDPVELAATLTAWLGGTGPGRAAVIGMSSNKHRVLRLLAMREKPSAKVPRVGRWLSVPTALLVVAGLAMAQTPSENKSDGSSGMKLAAESTADAKANATDDPLPQTPSGAIEIDRKLEDRIVDEIVDMDPAVAKWKEQILAYEDAIAVESKSVRNPDRDPRNKRFQAELNSLKERLNDRQSELRKVIARHRAAESASVPLSTPSPNGEQYLAEKSIQLKNDAVAALEEYLATLVRASTTPQYDEKILRLRELIAVLRQEIVARRKELALLARKAPPSEKNMVSIGSYTIEPPDIIIIDLLRATPKEPTQIAPLDKVQIQVQGTVAGSPIDGTYQVDSTGEVVLGPIYGAVNIKGLTRRQAQAAIDKHLCETLTDPTVSLTIDESRVTKPIVGEHLVGPDGTVNLGNYGLVYIAGMTIPEAKAAIEKKLADHFESPQISIDVQAYNSKVYYVITQSIKLGDNIWRFPVTGNETVLDAIAQVRGLSRLSSKNIWIARPKAKGQDEILPVRWDEIVSGGGICTNYQVFPGDRVFVAAGKEESIPEFIPGKLHVELLDSDEPNTWQWKLFLPKGNRYGWHIAYDDIPQQTPPPEGTSHITSGFSNEEYYEFDNIVLVTAKLRQLEKGNWRLSISSRINSEDGKPQPQMSGTSVEIPAQSLKWLGTVSSTDGQTLGDHGNLLIDAKNQIILLQRRPCQQQPDGSFQPATGTAPGFMIWLEKWGSDETKEKQAGLKPASDVKAQPQFRNAGNGHEPTYTVVLRDVPGQKDRAEQHQLVGASRVSDVIKNAKQLEQVTGFKIAILRTTDDDPSKEQLIDIDWVDLMTGKKANNIEILAGDKIFISGGKKVDVLRFPPDVDHQKDDAFPPPLRSEFEPQTSGERRN